MYLLIYLSFYCATRLQNAHFGGALGSAIWQKSEGPSKIWSQKKIPLKMKQYGCSGFVDLGQVAKTCLNGPFTDHLLGLQSSGACRWHWLRRVVSQKWIQIVSSWAPFDKLLPIFWEETKDRLIFQGRCVELRNVS